MFLCHFEYEQVGKVNKQKILSLPFRKYSIRAWARGNLIFPQGVKAWIKVCQMRFKANYQAAVKREWAGPPSLPVACVGEASFPLTVCMCVSRPILRWAGPAVFLRIDGPQGEENNKIKNHQSSRRHIGLVQWSQEVALNTCLWQLKHMLPNVTAQVRREAQLKTGTT